LGRDGQPPSQRELAEHTGMDAMTASQVARALEAKQLIRREQDQYDTRIKRLYVTEEGLTLTRKAIEVVESVDRAYFEPAPDGAVDEGTTDSAFPTPSRSRQASRTNSGASAGSRAVGTKATVVTSAPARDTGPPPKRSVSRPETGRIAAPTAKPTMARPVST